MRNPHTTPHLTRGSQHVRRCVGTTALAAALLVTLGACANHSSATRASGATTSPTGSAGSPDAAGPKACASQRVALVSTQKSGDQSVVDDMIDNGLNKAKSDLGATTKYVEALDPATYQSTLTALANAGYGIIATNFQAMDKPLAAVAKQFPKVKFIQIYGDPVDPPISNLRVITYRYDEGTYLSGVFAARMTHSKVLGYEAGVLIPGIQADVNAFKLGVQSVDPSVKVIVGEVGSFTDDAKAKQVSASLYAQGADIVQGDGPVIGLIQAAKDAGKLAVVGAEGPAAQAPESVVGITTIAFGKSLFAQISSACSGSFQGGTESSGVKSGVTGFHLYDGFLKAAPEASVTRARSAAKGAEEAQHKIATGQLVVPLNTAK